MKIQIQSIPDKINTGWYLNYVSRKYRVIPLLLPPVSPSCIHLAPPTLTITLTRTSRRTTTTQNGPRSAPATREFIRDMILSRSLTTSEIVEAARCTPRSVITIRSNFRQFGDTRARPIRAGRPRSITPLMLEALCDYLLEKPSLYLNKIAFFRCDKFSVLGCRLKQRGRKPSWWPKDRSKGVEKAKVQRRCGELKYGRSDVQKGQDQANKDSVHKTTSSIRRALIAKK